MRTALKLVFLGLYIAFGFGFFWPDRLAAWGTAFILGSLGLISLDRTLAVWDGKRPGTLVLASIAFLFGFAAIFDLLPYEAFAFGFTSQPYPLDSYSIAIDLIMGACMALALWIPFFAYGFIDAAVDFARRLRLTGA